MVSIYLLRCPITQEVKYIGATNRDLIKRQKEHLFEFCHGAKRKWIDKLKRKHGRLPIIEEIDSVLENERDYWEKFYIQLFKNWGFDLVNTVHNKKKIKHKIIKERSIRIDYKKIIQENLAKND